MNDNVTITVKKRSVLDEYELPSITFTVTADCDGPVWFRLIESLPPDEDDVEICFHPDNGHERWEVRDDTLVYEDVIWDENNAFTLYGIATRDRDVIQAYLTEPTVQVAQATLVERPESDDWVTLDDDQLNVRVAKRIATDGGETGDANDVGSDVGGAVTETHPGLADVALPAVDVVPDDTATGDEDHQGLEDQTATATERTDGTGYSPHQSNVTSTEDELPDECEGGQSAETGEDGSERGEAGEETDSDVDDPAASGVIEQIAIELREGTASDDAIETLCRQLPTDSSPSDAAKLDHCLTRIGELEAYVDALESFLDEEGTAQTLLADVHRELETVQERLDEFEDRLGTLQDQQSRFEDRLVDVESDVADVDELQADLTATNAKFADLDVELREMRGDLDRVEEWRSTVVTALSPTESDVQVTRSTEQN